MELEIQEELVAEETVLVNLEDLEIHLQLHLLKVHLVEVRAAQAVAAAEAEEPLEQPAALEVDLVVQVEMEVQIQ